MTVKKLIEELSKYPQDMKVFGGKCYLNEYKVINVEYYDKGANPYIGLLLELK